MDVADKQTPLSLDSKVPFEGFLSQSHQAAVPVEIPREKMAARRQFTRDVSVKVK